MRNGRLALERRMTATIEHRIQADLDALYATARANATNDLLDHHETAAAEALPQSCPYELEQIIASDWWPARAQAEAKRR